VGGFFVGSDGAFYGAAPSDGIFVIGSGGIKVLDGNFDTIQTPVQGSDGKFYDSTEYGGASASECGDYGCGVAFKIAVSPALPAPVQVSLSSNTVTVGSAVTATFKVLNAFSNTMQQCYGFYTLNGVTTPAGKVPGTLADGVYSGSATFALSEAGTYNLALTCGGIESGFATLTVNAYPTTTTLALSPTSVTPPGKVTATATVQRSSSGYPTGTVSFYYDTLELGSAPLVNGVATFSDGTTGVTAGKYAITAKYLGDSSDAASASSAVTVTVE
jgi:hypothetical protein